MGFSTLVITFLWIRSLITHFDASAYRSGTLLAVVTRLGLAFADIRMCIGLSVFIGSELRSSETTSLYSSRRLAVESVCLASLQTMV